MQSIREVMTTDPLTLSSDTPLIEAARLMRDQGVGDVLVTESGSLTGILTDRDITIRSVAEGRDPSSCTVGEICSMDITTISPESPVEDAVTTMRTQAIRRLPVVEDESIVGVISIGDLAMQRDEQSALADISAAPANT